MYVSFCPALSLAPFAPNGHGNNIARIQNVGQNKKSVPFAHNARSVNSKCRWQKRHRLKDSRSLGDLQSVAATIQQIEGWAPGTRSYRNNNPGNLMYVGQAGAIGQDAQGFAIFPDYQTGLTALDNQITLDASRGQTISQFTNIYAPSSDGNNPTSY